MTTIHKLKEESRYRLVFTNAAFNQVPQDKQYDVEELLDTARQILKTEADAEFPQYASLIAETLTTQRVVEYTAQETAITEPDNQKKQKTFY